jgi:hypothetical protein
LGEFETERTHDERLSKVLSEAKVVLDSACRFVISR